MPKIIIDISQDVYDNPNNYSGYALAKVIKNGIPLEDIKAEIETEADFCECMPSGKCLSIKKVIELIDKQISGKE